MMVILIAECLARWGTPTVRHYEGSWCPLSNFSIWHLRHIYGSATILPCFFIQLAISMCENFKNIISLSTILLSVYLPHLSTILHLALAITKRPLSYSLLQPNFLQDLKCAVALPHSQKESIVLSRYRTAWFVKAFKEYDNCSCCRNAIEMFCNISNASTTCHASFLTFRRLSPTEGYCNMSFRRKLVCRTNLHIVSTITFGNPFNYMIGQFSVEI